MCVSDTKESTGLRYSHNTVLKKLHKDGVGLFLQIPIFKVTETATIT